MASADCYVEAGSPIFRLFVGDAPFLLEVLDYLQSAIVGGIIQTIVPILVLGLYFNFLVLADKVDN